MQRMILTTDGMKQDQYMSQVDNKAHVMYFYDKYGIMIDM